MSEAPLNDASGSPRPFFYCAVVWGERFRNYLTDYTFRSLLAPGNLPADINRPKHLVICGPREDWQALSGHAVSEEIRRHAQLDWIEFDPARHRHIRSMAIGHSLCLKAAAAADAYMSIFPPDCLLSDGVIRRVGAWIDEGWQLVLTPAFRTDEDAILAKLGIDRAGTSAISRTADELNASLIGCLHSQVLATDIDADYFSAPANNFHIRDAAGNWLVSKNMAWNPALMDLRGIAPELLDEAGRSVLDSYIVAKMYGPGDRVHFVTGPNEYSMLTWGPSDWSSLPTKGRWLQRVPWTKRVCNDYVARKTCHYYLNWDRREDDWIKRRALLDATVMFGDETRDGAEMAAAARRLDVFLGRACPDLLNVGPASGYLKFLDFLNSASRKLEFLANALFNRDDGRRRLVRRVRTLSGRLLPLGGR